MVVGVGPAIVSSEVRDGSCGLRLVGGSALCCLSLDLSSMERVGDRSSSDSSAAEVGDPWCGCGVVAVGPGGAAAATVGCFLSLHLASHSCSSLWAAL